MTDLISPGRYRAVLHVVHHGLDGSGKQRCIMCGAVVLNHTRALFDGARRRVHADGSPILGFPEGPVTTIFPPDPRDIPVTVLGAIKFAEPCRPPTREEFIR